MGHGEAVVIGAGHNGLVGAILLADAGWDVLVLEQQEHVGGAIHSDRTLHPDYVTDWFSAFYPFAEASPILRALDLDQHGLHWSHAPAVLAHVLPDDRCAVLSRDVAATAASLDTFAAGDGAAWTRLAERFGALREPLMRSLFTPFPPVRGAAALARELGVADLLRFARFAVQPVRRAGEELFGGEGARLLMAGNAMHTDLSPESAGSALYGWLLAMLGQHVGFPVPAGGSGALPAALLARLRAAGGTVRTGAPVERIEVSNGEVRGVRLASGENIPAGTVLADVAAPPLYEQLLDPAVLPERLRADIRRFHWDNPTLKLNWALSGPIPWTAQGARGAGTVHLGGDMAGLARFATDLDTGELPADPFVVLGQMTTADASRSPAGTESAWAYTHLPGGRPLDSAEVEEQAGRLEEQLEKRAPGFGALVLDRQLQTPTDLEASDASLVRGALNGGTASVHQQLVFRPVPGLGRAETPVHGLYLASSSAHPGGGVHGGPGANAAKAALLRARATGRLRRRMLDAAFGRIYR